MALMATRAYEAFGHSELERQVRQLRLLQDTVRKINSILDLRQLLDEVVGDVAGAFGCSRTAVLFIDESTRELYIGAVRGFSNCTLARSRFKVGVDGIVGHVAATGAVLYTPDVRKSPYYRACEPTTLSEIDIPLISRGKVIGVFDAQSPALDGFSPDQIELLSALADNIAIAVENARLFRAERMEKERILREREEARQIQATLLPKQHPSVAGYDIHGVCMQNSAVGGDWYDYIRLSDSSWGIVLGDVCGKGMPAALLMSATCCLLRQIASADLRPSDVLAELNGSVLKQFPGEKFVTLIYGVLDSLHGTFTFANAGHHPPLHVPRNGQPAFVNTVLGLPIGIKECLFDDQTITLEAGDSVVMCSDGVLETQDAVGREFGVESICALFATNPVTASDLIDAAINFGGGGHPTDDATAVVIRRDAGTGNGQQVNTL